MWDAYQTVTTVAGDVTNINNIKKLVAVTNDTCGKLDGICNIAGINGLSYPLLETDDER